MEEDIKKFERKYGKNKYSAKADKELFELKRKFYILLEDTTYEV